MTDRDSQAIEALKWIVDVLQSQRIPFQITGGLAAKVYGSKRPLVDIDIDVPKEKLQDIAGLAKDYIAFGPARYKDDEWDLMLLRLNYLGQEIDIGGAGSARYFDKISGDWRLESVDFSKSEMKGILGLNLPVVERKHLIAIKKALSREVDIEDLKWI